MINTTVTAVKNRKHFYRDYYRKGLMVLIVFLIAEWIITVGMVFFATHRVVPAFYASSSDGILTKLSPRFEPNRSNKALLE